MPDSPSLHRNPMGGINIDGRFFSTFVFVPRRHTGLRASLVLALKYNAKIKYKSQSFFSLFTVIITEYLKLHLYPTRIVGLIIALAIFNIHRSSVNYFVRPSLTRLPRNDMYIIVETIKVSTYPDICTPQELWV